MISRPSIAVTFLLFLSLLLTGCPATVPHIDVQGHRGCRGLYPENSIPAFLHALELGVTTLEMDAVVTRDSQVVVSHEPFFSHEICTDSLGREITAANEKLFNIFAMDYETLGAFDCGTRPHPRFSGQKKQKVPKPKLSAVIGEMEAWAAAEERTPIRYNIEIKRRPEWDGTFHPELNTYVRLTLNVVREAGVAERTTIQSFDVPTLVETRRQAPDMDLVLLVDEGEDYVDKIAELGFYPRVLSPWYKLVDEDMMRFAADKHLEVIPWTVNEVADMESMLDHGVHGIITDYPDRLLKIVEPK